MAEVIKLSVEADKKAIFVYDATGAYDEECNSGGWGTPNLEPSDIEEATVEVFPPESETGIIINVIDALPNKDGIGFEILAEDLGLSEITSGVWKFVYRVKTVANEFEQQFSVTKYFDDVIACCIDSKKKSVSYSNTISEEVKKLVELETLFDNARWAACNGDMYAAQTIANYILTQCKCCK